MAVTWKEIALVDNVVLKSVITAKGDLITSTASATPSRLAIGTNGYILSVATDTPGWIDPATLAVATHATTHKSGGTDVIKLNEFAVPTSAVAMNGQQLTNHVIHTVADTTAMEALTPLVGKLVWKTDALAPYVCTVAV
jgi:hypothetical protein